MLYYDRGGGGAGGGGEGDDGHQVKYCQDNIQGVDVEVDGTKFFFHQGPFRFSFKTLWAFTGPG